MSIETVAALVRDECCSLEKSTICRFGELYDKVGAGRLVWVKSTKIDFREL